MLVGAAGSDRFGGATAGRSRKCEQHRNGEEAKSERHVLKGTGRTAAGRVAGEGFERTLTVRSQVGLVRRLVGVLASVRYLREAHDLGCDPALG